MADRIIPNESNSLWVNGAWEPLPLGTWVEIQNGKGGFSGNRGTIVHGPYGPRDHYDPKDHTKDFPPMYNILVTKPYDRAVDVNFMAHKLRKLSPEETRIEAEIRSQLPKEEQTNIRRGTR